MAGLRGSRGNPAKSKREGACSCLSPIQGFEVLFLNVGYVPHSVGAGGSAEQMDSLNLKVLCTRYVGAVLWCKQSARRPGGTLASFETLVKLR